MSNRDKTSDALTDPCLALEVLARRCPMRWGTLAQKIHYLRRKVRRLRREVRRLKAQLATQQPNPS